MTAPPRCGMFLAAVALLAGGSYLVAPMDTPPLYDGVGFPDEPYRYVDPPTGAIVTKPPAPVAVKVQVLGDGSNPAVALQTVEKGPQVALSLRLGLLQAPSGADAITVTIAPIRASTPPPNGQILGNTYRVSFTASRGGAAAVSGDGTYSIAMRIPQGTRDPVAMELFRDGVWTTLRTTQTGSDVYTAAAPGAGEIAPVLLSAGSDSSLAAKAGKGSSQAVLVVLGVVLLAAAGVVVFTMKVRRIPAMVSAQPPSDEVSGDVGNRGSSG